MSTPMSRRLSLFGQWTVDLDEVSIFQAILEACSIKKTSLASIATNNRSGVHK